ncbi:type II toxin-antitoxin system PemK/MazF family toxin [Geminocystis sp. CENA526]|uniref:type II toxin-antitoxin system PemK/MazF family toxin n=1 Tax=Geminocystis sp. CENA526 TaxID=1355871 RepID=UPI003D6E7B61
MEFKSGDVITVDFPGVKGIKRRPAVIVSSSVYHENRPDVIIGLITSQTKNLGVTDYILQDWSSAGLKVPSIFRSFLVTIPSSNNLVYIGHLSERDWQGICDCIKIALMGIK